MFESEVDIAPADTGEPIYQDDIGQTDGLSEPECDSYSRDDFRGIPENTLPDPQSQDTGAEAGNNLSEPALQDTTSYTPDTTSYTQDTTPYTPDTSPYTQDTTPYTPDTTSYTPDTPVYSGY